MSVGRVRCKMLCHSKKETFYNEVWQGASIIMSAVWEGTAADGKPACEENASFATATPSATFQIYIQNKPAADFYEEGMCYYMDSLPAGERKTYSEGYVWDYKIEKFRDPTSGEVVEMDVIYKAQNERLQREARERAAAQS